MQRSAALLVTLVLSFLAISSYAQHSQRPIQITADLRDAPRKLLHAELDIPVRPGPVALISPQWIPGGHGPYGPASNIVGVVFTADGKTLSWHRDPVHVYEYHVTVPAGASTLHAHVDLIATKNSREYATLEWEGLMLYPANTPVHDIAIQPTIMVPDGWGVGTSLHPLEPLNAEHPASSTIHFAPTTVEMLQDSPVLTGAYFREYPLAPDVTPKHYVDFIGSDANDVNVPEAEITQLTKLVHEGIAMYGAPHYTSYRFLVLIPRSGGGGGLEHHESSDNSLPRHSLDSWETSAPVADVLPHEFTHSWNGKYRRPAGLATPDYDTPMQDNLLWVYEGLTDYMGSVLATRIGALSPEEYREYIALIAAQMDGTSGRAWRSVEDTNFDSAMPRPGGNTSSWASLRRGADYYPEGDLIWLDVDTTIRKLTNDKKSLHDFTLLFLQKGGSGVPRVLPYELSEVVADLNQVAPNDWAKFFNDRIYAVTQHANIEGIEQGGYKLVYTDEPTKYESASLPNRDSTPEFWFSLGLAVNPDGTVTDVRVGGPADLSKISPGQKLLVVNGKAFTIGALHVALKASKNATGPIQFSVRDEDDVMTIAVNYHGGEKYPRLQRVDGTPDYLSEITKPMTSPAQ